MDWSFTGNWSEYLDMFAAGCHGVADADPTASVVGPATAINGVSQLEELLRRVDGDSSLRLDVLTIHSYGNRSQAWQPAVERARTALRSSAVRRPISINEFNTESAFDPDHVRILNSHALAPLVLGAFKQLLEFPDVASVHWAQTMDSGAGDQWGLITADGHAKASFNAQLLWASLPSAANQSLVQSTGGAAAGCVDSIASANATHALLLVWRPETCGDAAADAPLRIKFELGQAFGGRGARGTLSRISATAASFLDSGSEWLQPEPLSGVGPGGFQWAGPCYVGRCNR